MLPNFKHLTTWPQTASNNGEISTFKLYTDRLIIAFIWRFILPPWRTCFPRTNWKFADINSAHLFYSGRPWVCPLANCPESFAKDIWRQITSHYVLCMCNLTLAIIVAVNILFHQFDFWVEVRSCYVDSLSTSAKLRGDRVRKISTWYLKLPNGAHRIWIMQSVNAKWTNWSCKWRSAIAYRKWEMAESEICRKVGDAGKLEMPESWRLNPSLPLFGKRISVTIV